MTRSPHCSLITLIHTACMLFTLPVSCVSCSYLHNLQNSKRIYGVRGKMHLYIFHSASGKTATDVVEAARTAAKDFRRKVGNSSYMHSPM